MKSRMSWSRSLIMLSRRFMTHLYSAGPAHNEVVRFRLGAQRLRSSPDRYIRVVVFTIAEPIALGHPHPGPHSGRIAQQIRRGYRLAPTTNTDDRFIHISGQPSGRGARRGAPARKLP